MSSEPPASGPDTAPATATLPPCVLDIEASGFGRSSYPIEVGYVLHDGRARCTLIRPPAHWTHWDASAERVHGITRPTLLAHGRPAGDVARMLNGDLAGHTVYCDGWAHDYPWLALLFDEAGIAPGFRLESINTLFDDATLGRLSALQTEARRVLGVSRHRASSDAVVLQRALQRLRQP